MDILIKTKEADAIDFEEFISISKEFVDIVRMFLESASSQDELYIRESMVNDLASELHRMADED